MQRADRRISNRETSFGLADGAGAGSSGQFQFHSRYRSAARSESRRARVRGTTVHHMELKVYRSFLEYVIPRRADSRHATLRNSARIGRIGGATHRAPQRAFFYVNLESIFSRAEMSEHPVSEFSFRV